LSTSVLAHIITEPAYLHLIICIMTLGPIHDFSEPSCNYVKGGDRF